MAQYLDKAGLDALWTKIKGTFVAKTIKKSDSSNATQITHDGDTVSLSRGTISGTDNTSIYTASASIDIGADYYYNSEKNGTISKTFTAEPNLFLALYFVNDDIIAFDDYGGGSSLTVKFTFSPAVVAVYED